MSENSPPNQGISLISATAVVIANMIGTGVFTSLGFQVGGLPSGFVLLVLWAVGGLCAFCGALAYGELASAMPRSGGEYHFLSRAFHPAVGFIAGWLSSTVGFAAPIALAAMALGKYIASLHLGLSPITFSITVVLLTAWIHSRGVQTGARFQNLATWLKVCLVLVFIIMGAFSSAPIVMDFAPKPGDADLIFSPAFAISLVFVMYSYAGWNAATYIVEEVKDPKTNVPKAIALGTLFVAGLYIALNAVFLRSAPLFALEGQVDVGHVAASHLFGPVGGQVMSSLICLGLVSSISAMTWVGPRVTMILGQDLHWLSALGQKSKRGVPLSALLLQTIIVLALLITASFEQVLGYVQFSIQLCSFLTVLGLFWLRIRHVSWSPTVRCWGYPWTPLFFLAISAWMLIFQLQVKPLESAAGLCTVLAGLLIYHFSPKSPPPSLQTATDRPTECTE